MQAEARPRALSAAFVKTVRTDHPQRFGDGRGGHGLSLLVQPMQSVPGRMSRTWAQRLRINGRQVSIGLGSYPVVSLSEAREKALENRRLAAQGLDPRNPSGVLTFAEAAEVVIELNAPGWRNPKSADQWRASLRDYAYPRIGDKPVDRVTTADVLTILTPIWNEKRETARRVRQRIGKVLDWCVAKGLREDNPVASVGAALPSNGNGKAHMKALPHKDVADALEKVRQSGAGLGTKQAMLFLTLTATRSGEVRGARWEEVDLKTRTWTVPGNRTKTGREHHVPLADAAMQLLVNARALRDGSGLIFPSPTGKPMSDSTMSKLLRDLSIPAVPHGFRSSFRDWCADTGVDRELAESALAHTVRNQVEAAYLRSSLLERRRELMGGWAAYVLP